MAQDTTNTTVCTCSGALCVVTQKVPGLGNINISSHWPVSIWWGITRKPALFQWLLRQSDVPFQDLVKSSDSHCKFGYLDLRKKFLSDQIWLHGMNSITVRWKSVFSRGELLSFPALEWMLSTLLWFKVDARQKHHYVRICLPWNQQKPRANPSLCTRKTPNGLVGRHAYMCACLPLHDPFLLFPDPWWKMNLLTVVNKSKLTSHKSDDHK